jgi:Protein of unknown function (DUF1194)
MWPWSMSINQKEAITQRSGYIHALRDKRVVEAIQKGSIGRIAITYIEWSAAYSQAVIIPWRIISDASSAKQLADDLEAKLYTPGTTTSISGGIDFSAALFKGLEYEPARKVIDVSGDGYSEFGRPVKEARDEAVAAGITINGLAIMVDRANAKRQAPADLDKYFQDNVIGGTRSFQIPVRTLDDFSKSIMRKLVLEISSIMPAHTRETS